MKKLLFILMVIPIIGIGQSKIRNTSITSGNQQAGKVLKSDGSTNVVWDYPIKITTSETSGPATISGDTLNIPQYVGGGGLFMVYPDAGIPRSTGTAWDTSITDNSANWNTAYTDRLKWDGGSNGLNAATGRTSLGLGSAAQSASTDFAPASGSANYVQVSPSSGQSGNIWMGGTIGGTTAKLTNLTDGYLPYHISDASGLGNSPIYTDGSGNVGIGTTNLQHKFMLQSGVAATDVIIYQGMTTGVNPYGYIGSYKGEDTGPLNLVLQKFGGNVGIGYLTGTEIDNNKLAVNGSVYFNGAVNSTGYLLNNNNLFGSLSSNVITKWDGTKLVDSGTPIFNYIVQSLSGTNVAWNLANGKDATITLTGNTVITLSNAINGISGTLWVTNPTTVYTITFAGYVNSIDPFIRLASNMVITSGGGKSDDFTFKYNGTKLNWNGTLDRQ